MKASKMIIDITIIIGTPGKSIIDNMKILILGAPGMLGLSFVKLFSADRNIDLYCSTTSKKKNYF